ncbi:MAG TPA: glycosyltransferase family 1 protein [Frankiaceae bacterium]|nr:glycosyltransferase family 1 protein [Frankiaceae bacterium]
MRVGIDATPLLGTRTGVGTYVAALLDAFLDLDVTPVLTAFTWRGVEALPDHWPHAQRRFSARALQAVWSRVDWPPAEWLSGPVDVFHGTNFVLPPTRRARGVVTIHDLTYDHSAHAVTPASLRYQTLVPRALARGAVVTTPSEAVAEEVRDRYGLAPDRVVPTRLGVAGDWYGTHPRPEGLPGEYVLFVGNREPRKNLPVLLEAMRRLPDAPPLVLVGPPGWGPAVDTSGAITPGYLSGEALRSAVAHASVFAFPSRYEGFGLPPLEALATGTPVVASDIPVLREVLGGHASYAPVDDADAFAAAIGAALDAGDGGPAGRAARRAHAAQFTWARCARDTISAYNRSLGCPP